MGQRPIAAGKSSYDLIDSEKLFSELRLAEESVLLDVACGRGNYAVAASEHMGGRGLIHAFDLWEEGIELLREEISKRKIRNIRPGVADVGKKIPLPDQSVDTCLMATVLHDLRQDHTEKGALREARRVLKPDGFLAVVEFKKIEGPPGPPVEIRIGPEELERILSPYGFRVTKTSDVGPYHYLSLFVKADDAHPLPHARLEKNAL